MKLTTTLCAIALIATQATAEGIKPEPNPPVIEEPTSSGTDWLVPLLVVIAGVGLVMHHNRQPDHGAPRPLVEADLCIDKRGVFVACGEE